MPRSRRPRAIYISGVQISVASVVECVQEAGLDLIAVCEDAEAGLVAVDDERPDLVIIGSLPPSEAHRPFTLCQEIIARQPGTHVILLRWRVDERAQIDAAAVGASACLPIATSLAELRTEFSRVMARGRRPIDSLHVMWFGVDSLTPRQLEVLRLAAEGKSASEIARDLGIKPDTVLTHEKAMRAKLKVTSTAAAVKRARRLGMI